MRYFAKSVTFFALASLALSVACSNPVDKVSDDMKRKMDDWKPPKIDVNVDIAEILKNMPKFIGFLAEPTADGISRNEFSIDLTTNKPKDGIAKVEYSFKRTDFKTMNVTIVRLQEEGCNQLPEIQKEDLQKENDIAFYIHGDGNILGFLPSATRIASPFGKEVEIGGKTDQVLSFGLTVDSNCKKVSGKLEVQFRK